MVNTRDRLGRTALLVALMSGAGAGTVTELLTAGERLDLEVRLLHSHWSRSLQILQSHWLTYTPTYRTTLWLGIRLFLTQALL